MGAQIRKLWTQVEEIRLAAGQGGKTVAGVLRDGA